MANEEWKIGDIIQMTQGPYIGELFIVTDEKPFGAQGVLAITRQHDVFRVIESELAYVRCSYEQGTKVGHVAMMPRQGGDDADDV
jgi:hypothetical protein